MRDDERIEMYYKFGLLDWKNEQQLEIMKDKQSKKVYLIDLWIALERLLARIIRRILTDRIRS
ncbi:hypothetical protein [Desulfosporosinus sp. OT]|uniref:hypothetical protein n=1 Tax=Desulfosporosinus sp. OT TaxID=913865 RepID=UPI0002239CBF|nr:hypothetical protein [Desulfosporosinus sp. OT]EGW40114.1 hypothetical protein DOT_1986 [Desulfosporosinus sp. OT]